MAGRVGGNYLARALFPNPLVDKAIAIKYSEEGKPVTYLRRWHILTAFSLGYFTWYFHGYRTTPLVSEFAAYYSQPNEFQGFPDVGMDFLLIFESFLLILFYPIGGMLVDKYGTQMMVYGIIGQAIANWWWFLSFENYASVILSKVLSNISGVVIGSSLLRIANNWFGEGERAFAVAVGALAGNFGGGAALVITPLFSTGDDVINVGLLSCRTEELEKFGMNLSALPRLCTDVAEEAFCCAADTNIDGLNFFMAVIASAVAVYAFIVVKDAPPTPPSKSGELRKGTSFWKAMKLMFSHRNYCQICLTDFVSSGPPIVLFSTVDRIFPAAVSDFSTYVASGAFVLAIPLGAWFSFRLARTQEFYELTAAGYVSGFLFWAIVTVLIFVDTEAADYGVIFVGSGAIVCYVLWTVAVYELKMEYVFSSEYAIQGYVIALDRTIINLSATVFLAAIPPERYTGDLMSGRQFTFLVGAVFMLIGTILALTIPNKRDYLRKKYEEENDVTVNEILDSTIVYSHPPGTVKESRKESVKSKFFSSTA